ncbi:hypothetical protein D9611_010757 [Ephemerocybe angulata]|uniref:Uncharacterized protein n=1 Tax=Ephemerocybe angulata TaxID=980116 RepID=A0A8H5F1Z9_9AGAR|nr:hypothetical protein D9611_010757 [Tulosesus angulatus]
MGIGKYEHPLHAPGPRLRRGPVPLGVYSESASTLLSLQPSEQLAALVLLDASRRARDRARLVHLFSVPESTKVARPVIELGYQHACDECGTPLIVFAVTSRPTNDTRTSPCAHRYRYPPSSRSFERPAHCESPGFPSLAALVNLALPLEILHWTL